VAVEFGPPQEELGQGDLFGLVPSVYVETLGYMVKLDGNQFRLLQHAPESRHVDRPQPANAKEVRAHGVLLTHDCEIDKSRGSLQLALVRQFEGVPEEHRVAFRDNTRHRAFYLPAGDYLDEEAYVDLRRITVISPETLVAFDRLASMNEDGRRMLREQLFRFYTRHYLPGDWTEWPEDEQ
jgi:hypothetical protein